MMNDIQTQNFLSNYDDPAAALLTYFINENDNGAPIMPVPPGGNPSLLQLSPQDHAYSRISVGDQVLGHNVSGHGQNASYARATLPNTLPPQVPSSQAVPPSQCPQYADMHQHQQAPTAPTASNYTGPLLCNTNGNDQMLFDRGGLENSSGLTTHITEPTGPPMIKKFNNYSPPTNIAPQASTSGRSNYQIPKSVKCDRVPNNNEPPHSMQLNSNSPASTNNLAENRPVCPQERGAHAPAMPQPQAIQTHQPPPRTPEDIKVPLAVQNSASHPPLTAEVRTLIQLRITDQIIVNGSVVKETVKSHDFVRKGGRIPWTPTANDYNPNLSNLSSSSSAHDDSHSTVNSEDSKATLSLSNVKRPTDSPIPPYNSANSMYNRNVPTPTESKFNANELSNLSMQSESNQNRATGKGTKRQKGGMVNRKVKPKTEAVESEEARQETATALLSLNQQQLGRGSLDEGSPAKKEERREMTPEELKELRFLPLAVDNFVMAKWTDKNFYPGRIVQRQGDNRWSVVFDDGGKRTIHESEIISVPHLCAGQIVMVSFNEGFCLRGIIKRTFYERSELYYEVEYNDNTNKRLVTEKFARKDTFLTHDLGIALLSKQMKNTPENASKFADVDLNNIIPKRSRHTQQQQQQQQQTKVNDNENSSADEAEIFAPPKNKSKKIKTLVEDEPTGSNLVNQPKCLYDEAATLSNIDRNRVVAPEMELLLGPVPPLGSGLFQGIAFLLTSVDGCNVVNDNELNAGRSTAPFDVSYLSAQIEQGGGRVYETLEEAQDSTNCIEIVLIAYTYLRTVKYMQCLAAGIPCLMHTWVVDSCRENTLLKKENYLLPSGYSIINNSLPTDKSVFRKSAYLFKGMRFMLISKNNRLKDLWKPVLMASHATIVDHLHPSQGTSTRKATNAVDVIVTDSSCPAAVVKKAKQFKIPIVSSEYIAQCLINGKKLSYTAHEKFSYTHISK